MLMVGVEWQAGRLGIGEEHMASQIVTEVLIRMRPAWGRLDSVTTDAEADPPVAVVGTVEGDHHDLGAQAVRVLLEREDWKVYYLGADVPVSEFAEIQRGQGASLVCISFSANRSRPDLLRTVKVLSEFYRPGFPYALGLGGSLGDISPQRVPDGPFQDLLISRSAHEFLSWVRDLGNSGKPKKPRRVA